MDHAPAAIRVAILGIELDGQLKVSLRQFGRINPEVHPAAVSLHGRSRAHFQCLREIFDRARVPAQLGPSQATAAIDGFQRLPGLKVTIERRHNLVEAAQMKQGLRLQSQRLRMIRREASAAQNDERASACSWRSKRRPRSTRSSTR